jgi:hypothetical protein
MFNLVFGSQDPLPLAWGYLTFTIEQKVFFHLLSKPIMGILLVMVF